MSAYVMSKRGDVGPRLMWWYCIALLAFWVTVPEIRRLLEWHAGFRAFQFLSILPPLGMVVFALALALAHRPATSRPTLVLTWMWVSSFVYAGVIGSLSGHLLLSLNDLLQFIAPMFAALWLIANAECISRKTYLSSALLVIAAGVSIYGIIQFIALPSWDANWMREVDMVSTGRPEPFAFRVFSVLNSPEPCAAFLAVAMAFNLYRLNYKSVLPLLGLFLCSIALILTLVRSAWIALGVAFCVYLLFSSKPWRAASLSIAYCAIMTAVFFVMSPWLMEQTGQDSVANRFQTFTSLANDSSADARIALTASLLDDAMTYPTGQGLGIFGTGTQLTSLTGSISTVDGGLQERFFEMGFAGFAGYIATLALAFMFTIGRWIEAKRSGNDEDRSILAAVLAVQAALIILDFSIDSHSGLPGVLFWLAVGIALSQPQSRLIR
jgi:putative inorganic carbon (hco3(-)) transporter